MQDGKGIDFLLYAIEAPFDVHQSAFDMDHVGLQLVQGLFGFPFEWIEFLAKAVDLFIHFVETVLDHDREIGKGARQRIAHDLGYDFFDIRPGRRSGIILYGFPFHGMNYIPARAAIKKKDHYATAEIKFF
jgi:hypothetical protein